MTARPAHIFALVCTNRKGRWINHSFIGRTRRDVRKAYLDAHRPEYRNHVAQAFRNGSLEIVPVQITEIVE